MLTAWVLLCRNHNIFKRLLLEAGFFDGDRIVARRKAKKVVYAIGIGLRDFGDVRFFACEGNGGAFDDGALGNLGPRPGSLPCTARKLGRRRTRESE